MIVAEILTINGQQFAKTYSNKGMKVERDGVRYDEAIDPVEFGRQYTETDEPINEEATTEDYETALRDMGVDV